MRAVVVAVTVMAVLGAGCGRRKAPASGAQKKSEALPIGQGIDVASATPAQCAAGGRVYSVYADLNRNGSRDVDDPVLSEQVVCNGANGANGSDGYSVVFAFIAAPVEVCAAGGSVIMMATDSNRNLQFDADDANPQSANLCNGVNAPVNRYEPVDVILPCGNTVAYKEVLMRLGNGQVLAVFSNNVAGDMTRLSLLPDGSFMNTDNSGCTFSLQTSSDGLSRSISWFGEVQSTWDMPL